MTGESVSRHEQQLHRYCHGLESQLSYALNKEQMAQLIAEHPGSGPAQVAEIVTTAIRQKGPLEVWPGSQI
jgi:hypothetical protein